MSKFSSVLLAVACAVAVLAPASSANFVSRNGVATSGTSTGRGPFTITPVNGGPTIRCNDKVDKWTIQTRTKQEPTTNGAHFLEKATFEGKPALGTQTKNCEAIVGGVTRQVLPLTLERQTQQTALGQTTGLTVKFEESSNIEIEGLGCVITIPSKSNQELKEESAANIGTKGMKLTEAITGLTTTVNKSCEELGIVGGKAGEITISKGGEDNEEGVEIV
jgi:hypothetical protein